MGIGLGLLNYVIFEFLLLEKFCIHFQNLYFSISNLWSQLTKVHRMTGFFCSSSDSGNNVVSIGGSNTVFKLTIFTMLVLGFTVEVIVEGLVVDLGVILFEVVDLGFVMVEVVVVGLVVVLEVIVVEDIVVDLDVVFGLIVDKLTVVDHVVVLGIVVVEFLYFRMYSS